MKPVIFVHCGSGATVDEAAMLTHCAAAISPAPGSYTYTYEPLRAGDPLAGPPRKTGVQPDPAAHSSRRRHRGRARAHAGLRQPPGAAGGARIDI